VSVFPVFWSVIAFAATPVISHAHPSPPITMIFFAPVSRTVFTSAWNPGVWNPPALLPPFFQMAHVSSFGSLYRSKNTAGLFA
jgi:hypothetical protein